MRNPTSGEKVPAVVAKARTTIRRKQILKELEEARMRMYSFLRPDGGNVESHRENDSIFLTEVDELDGDLDRAMQQRQVKSSRNLLQLIYGKK